MSRPVEIESFQEKIFIQRIIGSVQGIKESPTVIAIGGIHGNERAGVNALIKVFKTIEEQDIQFSGNFYGISGNIAALAENIRFQNVDLNRIWTKEEILKLHLEDDLEIESQEQNEIYTFLKEILHIENGPFYFLDLHTTSSDTQPFITISDSLNNRKFSSNFSIPTVLGIEEYLEGPLLTYLNEYGHIALGFEAGQHEKEVSVDNCIAFLWLALVASNCLQKEAVPKYSFYQHNLSLFKEQQVFYKIDYRHSIKPFENFKMVSGFRNFQKISKRELLAFSNQKEVVAPIDGELFMPLYQPKGDDGFFIISKISRFWLSLSRFCRKIQFHHVLKLLPGVRGVRKAPYGLEVNPKTAAFLATEIFHLFGYRKKVLKKGRYYFIKRDRKVQEFL